ncbi:MAG TPA: SDR family NAD(P)-dependent oxidoreductase [Planctomycetes bacterium]|nr:SDR family NAD(P)-dependent oxidoreductase [Planctomycetota bacterium]
MMRPMSAKHPFSLQGRRVLITGASSGIGAELARQAKARGATLLCQGRDPARTQDLADEVGGQAFLCDLREPEARRNLARRASPIDVGVWNAGVLIGGPLEQQSEERIPDLLRLNLEAPLHLSRLFAKGLLERGGRLVLVSSGVALLPLPYCTVYGASKTGLTDFGRALNLEWEHQGRSARVLVAHPGATDTPMLGHLDSKAAKKLGSPKKSPKGVARGILDALEAGESEWSAGGPLPLFERIFRAFPRFAKKRVLGRAGTLAQFFRGTEEGARAQTEP